MKFLIVFLLFLNTAVFPPSSDSMTVVGYVTDSSYDYTTITIERVIESGSGISTPPEAGDVITVKLPAREKPPVNSRIEAQLLEKIRVGDNNTSYLLTNYRTISN